MAYSEGTHSISHNGLCDLPRHVWVTRCTEWQVTCVLAPQAGLDLVAAHLAVSAYCVVFIASFKHRKALEPDVVNAATASEAGVCSEE